MAGKKRVDRRVTWPPPPEPTNPVNGGMRQRRNGEPIVEQLTRWGNDNSLSCSMMIKCCNCGLVHNYTYNVVRGKAGKFYLLKRAYRVPGGN